jgi:hypothetical protein
MRADAAVKGDRVALKSGISGVVVGRWEGGNGDIPSLTVEWPQGDQCSVLVTDVALVGSCCRTCSKPIEWADNDGMGGRAGWYDPDVLDDSNDGMVCETTGDEHLPGASS